MDPFADFFQNRTAVFFLTLLTAGVILYPTINYQPWLASGDHGRDLYCFKATLDGAVPYRDYWWVYGPIMPYYYAVFLKFFGITIQSVLLGKYLLTMLAAAFIYLAVASFLSPLVSLIAALWFVSFQPDFHYTYNHAGGLTALLGILYCVFAYIKTLNIYYFFLSIFLVFILSLIKINIGLFALAALLIAFALIDFTNKNPLSKEKKYLYLLSSTLLPIFILGIYYLLIHDLPLYYAKQCFPYLSTYDPYYTTPLKAVEFLWGMMKMAMSESWASFFFAFLLFFSVIRIGYFLADAALDKKLKKTMFLTIIILCLFYLFSAHEYLRSGVIYRTYWATPFSTMLIFILIGFATHRFPKAIKVLLYLTLLLILILRLAIGWQTQSTYKNPQHYLAHPRGRIYTTNPPQWFAAVQATTQYLQNNLKKDETFLALPYDPLYYYLTDKKSPSRQLIFFEYINISSEQEKEIIKELETKKINTVLITNRAYAKEAGLGTFGKTYCPLLEKYIKNNFEPLAAFGDWANEPGWGWHHGTKIMKRIMR